MPLLLALSCLQGRTQDAAWGALLALAPDGVQLTPGNLPSPGFAATVATSGMPTTLHHGYVDDAYRADVWDRAGRLLVPAPNRSVHAPLLKDDVDDAWWHEALDHDVVVEVMFPGYALSGDDAVAKALDLGLRLAVDVSHLFLQRTAGVLSTALEQRLLASPRVVEVHVSANDGKSDSHLPLTAATSGLGYARDRLQDGLPVVVDSHWHKLNDEGRRRQMSLLRDGR